MASNTTSTDWCFDEKYLRAVDAFHLKYASVPTRLKRVKSFHEPIISGMVEDVGIFEGYTFTGSSYEGVKIGNTEGEEDFEFDVNCTLKRNRSDFPLIAQQLQDRPGYFFLKVGAQPPLPHSTLASKASIFLSTCVSDINFHRRILDAGKAIQKSFGELHKWKDRKSTPNCCLKLRQHGPAIQLDVETVEITGTKIAYSVDIAPTIETNGERYVAKPLKKRTPDSMTWFQLPAENVQPNVSASQRQGAKSAFNTMNEVRETLANIAESNSLSLVESQTYVFMRPNYLANLRKQMIMYFRSYEIKEMNDEREMFVVLKQFKDDLEAIPVSEKPGYVWLKPLSNISHLPQTILKYSYLPGGKYLDIRATVTMFVDQLEQCVKNCFLKDHLVFPFQRKGALIRLTIQPDPKTPSLYECVDIILVVQAKEEFYVGLPEDYKDVPDSRAWRQTYSNEESSGIRQAPDNLKTVFRILKALRNREPGLAQLNSYHFKAIFLSLLNRKDRFIDWEGSHPGRLLLLVLEELEKCLEAKSLPMPRIPEINLLSGMLDNCLFHTINRIKSLRTKESKMMRALGAWNMEELAKAIRTPTLNEGLPQSQVQVESRIPEGFQLEAERKVLGIDSRDEFPVIVRVSDTIEILKFCENEWKDFDALLVIDADKNNLKAVEIVDSAQKRFILRPAGSRNTSTLTHTVSRYTGLVDYVMTREYASSELTKILERYDFGYRYAEIGNVKSAGIRVQLLKPFTGARSYRPTLTWKLLTAYKVGHEVYIGCEEEIDTTVWTRMPYNVLMNKVWKASNVTDCGRRVVRVLARVFSKLTTFRQLLGLVEGHLRTVLLWEMEDQPDWSDNRVAERFMDVLERLNSFLKEKNIPDYFFPRRNLISGVENSQVELIQKDVETLCNTENLNALPFILQFP